MPPLSDLILPLTIAFALAGSVAVLIVFNPKKYPRKHGLSPVAAVFEMACTVCQRDLVIPLNAIPAMSPPEMALVVSAKPEAMSRKLGEYRCPYCDAAHAFAVDCDPVEWIIANAYEPQTKSSRCANCRKPLRNPTWPDGARSREAAHLDELLPDHGLVCSRCNTASCVECCRDFASNRIGEESLLCPRCGRGPIHTAFRF